MNRMEFSATFSEISCWFAAKEETALDLSKKGIKYHFIPQSIFENAGIGANFECDYSAKKS